MTMSNDDRHEYEQVNLINDDAHDADEDIELVGGRRRHRSLGSPSSPAADTASFSSSVTKWIVILFLMIGMYILGMKAGKTEVINHQEGHDDDHDDKTTKQQQDIDNNYGTSFTLESVQKTRQAAQDLISTLQEYYGGKEQAGNMMLDSWLTPWDFENTTKNNFTGNIVNKLVDTMARALVTDDQEDFIIGTIGSSVAAGHDNCNYDSYELQMERTFGPVWKAAGMKLSCQNAGEGGGCGDDYSNQVFCIQQNVSPNIDIAHCEYCISCFVFVCFLFTELTKFHIFFTIRYLDLL